MIRLTRGSFSRGALLVSGLAASLCATPSPAAAQADEEVVWRNAVGLSIAPVGGVTVLTKTASTSWGNAGAVSTQILEAGGYVEFSTTSTSTQKMVGLASGDSSQTYNDIEYAINLQANGNVGVNESGSSKGTFGTYTTSDRFRVEVGHGKARYLKNGVVFYTSNTAPKYPLLVDTAFYTTGGTLTDVRLGRTAWRNVAGVSLSAGTLTKTDAVGWTAGAASMQAIVSGDGYAEFTANETNTTRACGLGTTDSSTDYTDIDFGIYLSGADVFVSEGPSALYGPLGTYASGDRFRVEVRGGVVRYLQNGAVIYTSSLSPQYPLYADASLYDSGATLADVVVSNLIWTGTVGASFSGGTLVKDAGGSQGWNAGATSTNVITGGSGFVEFSAVETGTAKICGLGTTDQSQDYTDVDFGILLDGGDIYVFEGPSAQYGPFGTYTPGDRFRVEVSPGTVRYRQNGIVFYTSALGPSYPLSVDTALYDPGATLAAVTLGTIVWTNDAGAIPWGSGLLNAAATGWNNAGAVSTASIPSGDGWVEATAQDTLTQQVFGLGIGDASRNRPDIEFGAYLTNGTFQVYESGTSRGSFGTYVPGDRIRVEVMGGAVKYKRNGTVVYTSNVAPQYPLVVDTAAYTTKSFLADVVTSGFVEMTEVPAPTFSPAAGTYAPPQSVTLSCAVATADIRYTTDGSEPTASSQLYTTPLSLTVSTTLKAKAFQASLADSDTATAVYTIQVEPPVRKDC